MTFDGTAADVAWNMNTACRRLGIKCSEGDAI